MNEKRFMFRLSAEELDLLRKAGEMVDMTITDFIKLATVPLAKAILSNEGERAENITRIFQHNEKIIRTKFELQRDLGNMHLTETMDQDGKVFMQKYQEKKRDSNE